MVVIQTAIICPIKHDISTSITVGGLTLFCSRVMLQQGNRENRSENSVKLDDYWSLHSNLAFKCLIYYMIVLYM